MDVSILYCGECAAILAAAPGLGLTVECVAHTIGGVTHKGFVALRLRDAVIAQLDLADLNLLSVKYVKADYAEQLEPIAGSCP